MVILTLLGSMFREQVLLATLLVLLFSVTLPVRVQGHDCQVEVMHGKRHLLAAVIPNLLCKKYLDGTSILRDGRVTYFPPNSEAGPPYGTHGPPRITTDYADMEFWTKLREIPAKIEQLGPFLVRVPMEFPNEDDATSWLRNFLKIQCSLVFNFKYKLFLILDLNIDCPQFQMREFNGWELSDLEAMTTSMSIRSRQDGLKVCHLRFQKYWSRIWNGLLVLRLTKRPQGPQEEVLMYDALALPPFLLWLLNNEPSSSSVVRYQTVRSDVQGKFKFTVWITCFNTMGIHRFGLAAVFDSGVEDLNGEDTEILEEIFEKTPRVLEYAFYPGDGLQANPRMLEMTYPAKQEFWSDIKSGIMPGAPLKIRDKKTDSIAVELQYIGDQRGALSWATEGTHWEEPPGPYEPLFDARTLSNRQSQTGNSGGQTQTRNSGGQTQTRNSGGQTQTRNSRSQTQTNIYQSNPIRRGSAGSRSHSTAQKTDGSRL